MRELLRINSAIRSSFVGFVSLACFACAPAQVTGTCENGAAIGKFQPSSDLLLSHFDIKPDVDDLHSIAALATIMSDEAYGCLQYYAVMGTYGIQGGNYIDPAPLADLAFGDNWLDAHHDYEGSLQAVSKKAAETLSKGGHIWIQEAGQSDFTFAVLEVLAETVSEADLKTQVHVVQHSDWNESVTSPDKLASVKRISDYVRIKDGNAVGNGTPGFNSSDSAGWEAVLAKPVSGPVWREAKALADARNPDAAYVNPAVAAGGFDFSDTVELAYILGFDDLRDHTEFFERFANK